MVLVTSRYCIATTFPSKAATVRRTCRERSSSTTPPLEHPTASSSPQAQLQHGRCFLVVIVKLCSACKPPADGGNGSKAFHSQ